MGYKLRFTPYEPHLTPPPPSHAKSPTPHGRSLPRGDRNVEVPHAEAAPVGVPERVDDGVGNGGGGADGGGLADAFGAERMMRRGRTGFAGFPVRRFNRGRQQIIHKTAALNVAVLVVENAFVQRRRQVLRQTAVNLAFDDSIIRRG